MKLLICSVKLLVGFSAAIIKAIPEFLIFFERMVEYLQNDLGSLLSNIYLFTVYGLYSSIFYVISTL